MDITRLKETFKNFVETFDLNDEMIDLKYQHSLRVMELSKKISENSRFSKEDIQLSIIIGILHDYARFHQWKRYKTYSDIKSIDHGNFAVELLTLDVLSKYTKNKDYYKTIYNSIKLHNKKDIPENINKRDEMFLKVIRDADKLDILYLFGKDKKLLPEDENIEISEKVKEAFLLKKQVDRKYQKNKIDKIILALAMVYDLNYKYSFIYLKENKLIEKIYEKVQNKNALKEYFDLIEDYIDEKVLEQ